MAWAVIVNLVLTLAQIVGGLMAGSLSLIADALHNFSDAISLGIAFAARRIARRPSDETMTFGYVRAEVVAALINYTTLIVIGIFLVYEAILRFFEPQAIEGWLVVAIAAVALVVDVATVALTYALSKESMNVRAAFVHNIADALGSVGVIIAGTLIILFDWRIVDPIVTLLIAGYILWMAFSEIGDAIRVLMQGTPPGLDLNEVIAAITRIDGVEDVHHLHAWMIDETQNALEAHVVISSNVSDHDTVRQRVKAEISERFGIAHATLEMEHPNCCDDGQHPKTIGHAIAAE